MKKYNVVWALVLVVGIALVAESLYTPGLQLVSSCVGGWLIDSGAAKLFLGDY